MKLPRFTGSFWPRTPGTPGLSARDKRVRAETIEEAARLAENWYVNSSNAHELHIGRELALHIRKLKGNVPR